MSTRFAEISRIIHEPLAARGRVRQLVLRNVALLLIVAALLSSVASYVVVTRHAETSLTAPQGVVWGLIGLNILLLGALMAVVAQRAVSLWRALRANAVGSRLQTRILILFSAIAILPAIIMSAFAALFFNAGIQTWFDKRVSTALQESIAVANSYLAEHQEVIRDHAIAMANGLDPVARYIITSPSQVNSWLTEEASKRSLMEAVVIYRNRIVAQTALSFTMLLEQLPADVHTRAENGEVVVFLSDKERVRALIKLHNLPDAYLLVGKLIDDRVVQHMENAQGGVEDYQRLQKSVHKLQAMFLTLFILIALLLLTAAIWYGILFATRLVGPITRLINAAERVRAGDYTSPVEEGDQQDELATLARAFNRMMGDLEQQRQQLLDANRQLDARRRFTETVLFGVSAGVIAVDLDGVIMLHNRSALALLQPNGAETLVGQLLEDVIPAAADFIHRFEERGERSMQEEIVHTAGDRQLTLLARITAERDDDHISRYVVTFDDISELVAAQRTAAWADVARRVAHEIKNPLTPIHLATDRLRKKYAKQITDEQENYNRYLDTIGKHVADIGKMVEEFVSFARMPTPVMKEEPLHAMIRKVIFSEQVAHSDISYQTHFAPDEIYLPCDERQFSRMLANLLKNAAEALEAQEGRAERGEIRISTTLAENRLEITVEDNGPGFPADKMSRLTEPYITTREKGTGLGLAIVKKIVEDHGGKMILKQGEPQGARVVLSFYVKRDINVTHPVANM
jgi:two-component system nitrogen regulation sensor histidine kinase NtrY